MLKEEIFWASEDNGEKLGHSGNDPGVSTEMYYYPSKKAGVILFVNTDIDRENYKAYAPIYNQLLHFTEVIPLKR